MFKELYSNPIIKIGMTFVEIFPVGLFISLVSAAILWYFPRKVSNV